MGLYPGLHHVRLLVQHADHRGGCPHGDGDLGLSQLPTAQGNLDLPRLLRSVTAAGPLQRRGDLRAQSAALAGSAALASPADRDFSANSGACVEAR
jgi:hypothetical protein